MRLIWTGAVALSAMLGGTNAAAQNAERAEDQVTTSVEVVVTVQKREQALKDVPMAVTAFTARDFDRLGVTKFDELSLYVPGFYVQEQSANNTGFVLRGVNSDTGDAQSEPRVALFFDGAPASRNRGAYVELFDIERVEVARGPQATLFGRGALIGGINVIQKKANPEQVSVQAAVAAGTEGYQRAFGAVNAPIVDGVLGVRVAGTYRARDGHVENRLGGDDLGGVQVTAGRVALAATPSDRFRFDLIANHHADDNAGTAFKSGTYAPVGGSANPFAAAALTRSSPALENGEEIGLDREVQSLTGIATFDINDAFTLTSITGWRSFESVEVFDPDGFYYPLALAVEDAEGDQVSQELRLNFDGGGRFTGFAGISYFEEEGTQRTPLVTDERLALALLAGQITPVNTPPAAAFQAATSGSATTFAELSATGQILLGLLSSSFPGGTPEAAIVGAIRNVEAKLKAAHVDTATNGGETQSFDVYLDGSFAVTDALEVSAGVRWTEDDKTSTIVSSQPLGFSALGALQAAQTLTAQAQAAALAGNLTLAGQLGAQATAIVTALTAPGASLGAASGFGLFLQPTPAQKRTGTFDDVTYRASVKYALSDAATLYANYGTGRRPEVLSLVTPAAPGAAQFEVVPAEQVDSIEVGAKYSTSSLFLDGSVFYYEYSNFQTQRFINNQLVNVNDGDATASGFEGSFQWRPSDSLELFGGYTFNLARLQSGANDGNRLRLSPDHKLSAGLTARRPAFGGEIYFTPSYSWQSLVYFDNDNDRRDGRRDEFQDSYGLLNARLGFESAGVWTVELFATNIADEEYLIDAGNLGDNLGIPTFIRGAPQLIGLEVKASF